MCFGQANVSLSSLTHWYFSKRFDADLRFETLEELALEVEDRHRPQASTVEQMQIPAVWNTSHVLFSISSLYISESYLLMVRLVLVPHDKFLKDLSMSFVEVA